MFAEGKGNIDVAQALNISIDKAAEFHDKWSKDRTKKQNAAFSLFAAGKDLLAASTEVGVSMAEAEDLYRTYLKAQHRQEEIQNELKKDTDKHKRFTPPFFVTKMIRNPWTGKGYKLEKCPMSFDTVPISYTDFEDFAVQMGDGEYSIVDAENKKAGHITVTGMGFSDPADMDEYGYGADGYARGRMGRMMHGGMRRPGQPYGMPVPGMPGMNGIVDPYLMPEDAEAMRMLGGEERRRNLYYRVSEMATERGDIQSAMKYLQMSESMGGPQAKVAKSLLDELVEVEANKDKLGLLKRFFGGKEEHEDTEEESELKKVKMYGDLAKELIPAIRDNIIDPVTEAVSGESRGIGSMEEDIDGMGGGNNGGGLLRRNSGKVGSGWKAVGRIQGRTPPPNVPNQPIDVESQVMEEEPVVHHSHPKIQEQVEIDPVALGIEEDEDMAETEPAPDYGEKITAEELDIKGPVIKKVKVEGSYKLGLDEKWMLNKGFPRFKKTIEEWIKATKDGNSAKQAVFSPERVAREDFNTMTKSSYSVFIGKKRLLKSYHAAKEGPEAVIGRYGDMIEKELETARNNGMDGTAELLRQNGTKRFAAQWEPPPGMNKREGIKKLMQYLILKDCWGVFKSDKAKQWFDRYCKEFVVAVDEDIKFDDKRNKIREMVRRGPTEAEVKANGAGTGTTNGEKTVLGKREEAGSGDEDIDDSTDDTEPGDTADDPASK
jgi:hypothetical protein